MINKVTLGFALVAALGLAAIGCGDDSTGTGGSAGTGGTAGSGGSAGSGGGTAGTGGDAGTGGTGGMMAEANVTGVHLAPDVPAMGDTEVEIFVNGAASGVTLSYGETTGRIPLDPGTYDLGIGLPDGDAPLLELEGVVLEAGADFSVIAYAVTGEIPFNVFVLSNSTAGLEAGSGRVFVAHGANDPVLDPVNVVTTDAMVTECEDLIPGFAFGDFFPMDGVLDLPEGEVIVGFTLDDQCPPLAAGPVTVPITPGVVSIAVAVDEDPSEALALELWALVDADTLVRLINTEP